VVRRILAHGIIGGMPVHPLPAPWVLEPARKAYAWGSPTLIPELLGEKPDGEPVAELWFGTHPGGPATVRAAEGGAVLGTLDELAGRLPFMVKLIAAATPLSIQVHPDAAHAAEMFASENAAGVDLDSPDRRYKDAGAKPEIVCALGPFDALIDFRPAAAIVADLDAAGLISLADALRDGGIAAGVRWVLRAAPADVHHAIESLRDAGNELVAQLAATYPGDRGVVLATFLNPVRLAAGDAAFLAAGTVHAYLGGLAVEVMATSDNVLRVGLTSKLVDVDEFLAVARLQPGSPDVFGAPDGGPYPARAPEFSLLRHDPGSRHAVAGPALVVCTQGEVTVAGVPLAAGHGAYVPANGEPYPVEGAGQAFVALPPVAPEAHDS
jgi:mannose-6-phosphate isomerase